MLLDMFPGSLLWSSRRYLRGFSLSFTVLFAYGTTERETMLVLKKDLIMRMKTISQTRR